MEITAYSQQSRFHRETFDANNTDIDIKGVNISVNNKELLVDAHLRFKPGVRYGMVGQNGVGKSGKVVHFCRISSPKSDSCLAVLMSVLGNNILVGLPQNVRILHIAQLEEVTSGRTILQEILSADTDRSRIIKEAHGLSTILNPQRVDLPLCSHSLTGFQRELHLGRRLEHSHPRASAFSGSRCP